MAPMSIRTRAPVVPVATAEGVPVTNFDALLKYNPNLALVAVDHSHRVLETDASLKGFKRGLRKAARNTIEMFEEFNQLDTDDGDQLLPPSRIRRMSAQAIHDFRVAELREIYDIELAMRMRMGSFSVSNKEKISLLMKKMRLAHVFVIRKDLAPPPGYDEFAFKRYRFEKEGLRNQMF